MTQRKAAAAERVVVKMLVREQDLNPPGLRSFFQEFNLSEIMYSGHCCLGGRLCYRFLPITKTLKIFEETKFLGDFFRS